MKSQKDSLIIKHHSLLSLTAGREWFDLLKPGSYGVMCTEPAISHKTSTCLEDVGFEIRDNGYYFLFKKTNNT